ncbi:MAG: glycine zipper 2TM domain-containing protein [Limnohabitans sp.]
MKQLICVLALLSMGTLAWAQEVGRVISSIQVIQQVSVPRQVCTQEQVPVQQNKSGAGAAMGAIAGGVLGNQIGGGSGRAAATALGIFGGAIVGNNIEGAPPAQMQTVQNCTSQNILENRVMGYNVTYEFNGKQYTVQLPRDPGPTIRLNVTPAPY